MRRGTAAAVGPVGVVAAVALLAAARVPAQEPDEGERQIVRPPISLSFEVDGQRVDIDIRAMDVELKLDGDDMPSDRYLADQGVYQLMDRYGAPFGFVQTDPYGIGLRFPRLGEKAYLGVDLRPISDALAAHLDLDQDEVAHVVNVTPGSPADKSGVKQHDIIVKLDGEGPVSRERLRKFLDAKKPGETVRMTVVRRGGTEEIHVPLGRSPTPLGNMFFRTLPTLADVFENHQSAPRHLLFDALQLQQGAQNDQQFDVFQFDHKAFATPKTHWNLQQPELDLLSKGGFFSGQGWRKPASDEAAEESGSDESRSAAGDDRLGHQIERLEQRIGELEALIRSLRDRRDN